jgi:hypothetical protein
MHVIQPFTDFSYVKEDGPNPSSVLQFDRFEPSTQLRAIDFHSLRRLIRLPIGRSGAWVSATSWKPDGTIQR